MTLDHIIYQKGYKQYVLYKSVIQNITPSVPIQRAPPKVQHSVQMSTMQCWILQGTLYIGTQELCLV